MTHFNPGNKHAQLGARDRVSAGEELEAKNVRLLKTQRRLKGLCSFITIAKSNVFVNHRVAAALVV